MATGQCYKTCEQTSCQQKSQQHGSLGQKVAGLFKGHHNDPSNNPSGVQTHTQSYSQTHVSQSGHATSKTQFISSQTQTKAHHHDATAGTNCHGRRTKREHKRNLVQKIKDGLTGHSSDSGSSSSESESDNENCNCEKRKK